MPNWCNNSIELEHADPKMIERATKALEEGKFFSEFAPCPKELQETTSGFYGKDTPEQLALEKKQRENTIKYGYSDWYEWNCSNWGTKWEACEPYATKHSPNFISASFDTAWSAPLAFYRTLQELGFIVKAYYYEPGMGFCGLWDDGDDESYDIHGNSEWVMDNIPSEIDFMFCISEGMAEFEEMEREEQE